MEHGGKHETFYPISVKKKIPFSLLTCCPSFGRPTPVSIGLLHYDGELVFPHQSVHVPSSSAGTLLSPGRSLTSSCPQNLWVLAFDSIQTGEDSEISNGQETIAWSF